MARSSSPRERPSREGILASAEALFAERGYGAPSLRDVMAAAGCSTTAFYARFPSKEAVLEALIDDLMGDLQRAAVAVVAEARSVEDGFARGIGALVDVLAGRRALVGIALSEGLAHGPVRERMAAMWALVASVLAGGLGPDGSARAWALVGGLSFTVTRWAVLREVRDEDLASELAAVADVVRPPPT